MWYSKMQVWHLLERVKKAEHLHIRLNAVSFLQGYWVWSINHSEVLHVTPLLWDSRVFESQYVKLNITGSYLVFLISKKQNTRFKK